MDHLQQLVTNLGGRVAGTDSSVLLAGALIQEPGYSSIGSGLLVLGCTSDAILVVFRSSEPVSEGLE